MDHATLDIILTPLQTLLTPPGSAIVGSFAKPHNTILVGAWYE